MGVIHMPGLMGIDIETYSSAPLPRCGVYRYCDAPDFEILLFSYAFDDEPVQTIDLARGKTLPKEVISALEDPGIIKVAYRKRSKASASPLSPASGALRPKTRTRRCNMWSIPAPPRKRPFRTTALRDTAPTST